VGKERLGSISNQDDRYLRSLYSWPEHSRSSAAKIHGAGHRPWLTALLGRRPARVAAFFVHQTLAISYRAAGWDARGFSSIGLAGNCSTVALCPAARSVTRTIVPFENSSAS
jgi:hypothetical protein